MLAGVRAPAALSLPEDRRRTSAVPRSEFLNALERASGEIRDPVAKLRFIRGSLARFQRLDRCVRAVPSVALRRWIYRWLSMEGLEHLMSSNPMGGTARVSRSAHRYLLLSRAVLAGAALAILALAVGTGIEATRLAKAATRPKPAVLSAAPAVTTPAASKTVPPVAAAGPPLRRGVAPAGVWLVEKGPSWEQYSNGLRIDTTYSVQGEPRRYRIFHPDGSFGDVQDRPRGILYHTSESDIWPLEAAYNENLRDSSQRLLRYLRRNHVYHYLIDRFGRVFRVVTDETKANHAGYSVWTQGDDIYLNLNGAFIGVSFETRWEGGLALPITQAQFAAGRTLTEYLRHRWDIAPEMCVTHGLTSVNPHTHLIGHHLDWARGFPFEAYGLPDQYSRPAPAVALFGFGYDEHLTSVLGEPWAGVRAAERTLGQEASRQDETVDEVRRARRNLYDQWIAEQARDEDESRSRRADRVPTPGTLGG